MRAWIDVHVEVIGQIEQSHLRGWATVLRVPTADGVVWFKAARDAFAHEARLLQLTGPLAPDLLPDVIASRPEDGWLLLSDAGERARERPVEWRPLLARYAELQLAATPLAADLLEAGAPDLRPAALRARVESLLPWLELETAARLRDRLPEVDDASNLLAASPLAPTVEHGDLHDGNVFVHDGRVRILDWGDAAVAHPLLTLTVEMEPDARDAYLEPFTARASRAELEAEVETILGLRYLLRAVNWERVVRYDASYATAIEERVVAFLSGDGT